MAEFASAISGAGFRVKHFKVSGGKSELTFTVEELEECSAVIAEIQETDLALFLHLSYLIGRGKNVWIVSEDADMLPEVLKKASFISSKVGDKCDLLINQIRERLNIETPPFETVGDFTSLISWIREEPKRIAGLSSKDFETFVLLLLSELGLNREADLNSSSGDLIFSDPATHTLFLVESKNYVSGHKIGVGEIERSVANAMNLSCDFTVLVSANEFTRSAVEYAKLCAPPVWLIGRENLEFLISSDPKSTPKAKERVKGLFRWIMGKEDKVSEAAQLKKHHLFERALLVESGDDSSRALEIPLYMKRNFSKNRLKFRFVEYGPCEVFVSFGKQEKSDEINQQILQFVNELDSWGIVVWHDSPALPVGNQCLKLPDVASAVKRSDVMLYFLDQNVHQSMRSMKTLQTLALELSKSKEREIITCVIGNDTPWNRLKLPSMFSESVFLHPYESEWKTFVLNLCQQLIKLHESALRPTEATKTQGRRFIGNMNGERYLANSSKSKMEVHDLDNEQTKCQIDEIIKAGHDRPYDSLSDANSAGYDNCAYCTGGSTTIGSSKRSV